MDDNQWMYTESGETPCISVLRGIDAVERECIADVKDWWGRAAGSGVMWQSIKWHIIWLGVYKKTHLRLALLCEGGWFRKANSGGASVDVHMAGQRPKKYAKDVRTQKKWW